MSLFFVFMRMLMTMMVMFAHSVVRASCETFGYALFHARMHGAHTFEASIFTEQALSSSAYCYLPMVSFLAYCEAYACFRCLGTLWQMCVESFSSDESVSLFCLRCLPISLSQLYWQWKIDRAVHLLTTAAAMVNTFAEGSNAPNVWSTLMITVCVV